jgi:hypothetical protein
MYFSTFFVSSVLTHFLLDLSPHVVMWAQSLRDAYLRIHRGTFAWMNEHANLTRDDAVRLELQVDAWSGVPLLATQCPTYVPVIVAAFTFQFISHFDSFRLCHGIQFNSTTGIHMISNSVSNTCFVYQLKNTAPLPTKPAILDAQALQALQLLMDESSRSSSVTSASLNSFPPSSIRFNSPKLSVPMSAPSSSLTSQQYSSSASSSKSRLGSAFQKLRSRL